MVEFIEIETKYNAKDISLFDFRVANLTVLGPAYNTPKHATIGSYDHYAHSDGPEQLRHRDGPDPQLTAKAKTSETNNFRRREANVHLAPGVDQTATVNELCSILGLTKRFSLYKDSEIFWYDRFNTVYYVIYEDATKTKELARYIEIEMSETHPWESEEQAWQELQAIERHLSTIGITPQRRVRKSLFELFRVA